MTIRPKLILQKLSFLIVCLAIAAPIALAENPWNLKQLSQPPKFYAAPGFQEPGVRAIFFDALPWRGKPTRVFAWYGLPANPSGGKVPAMVLVHGGNGTAFADWVRLWTSRGYAAIAIDTCGNVPSAVPSERTSSSRGPVSTRDESGGPACWDASFNQVDWPVQDQWTYHAVADIVLANSLLQSFHEIDRKHIGITGISWGGYLTSIAGSIDTRFRFAAPVYGCGFLGEDSYWVPDFKKMGPAKAAKWLDLWDPSVYLSQARIPFLWVDGTNDFAYPLDSLQKSYRLPRGPRTLSFHLRMPHSHADGESPKEISAFADHILKSGPPLAVVLPQTVSGQNAQVSYQSKVPIVHANLLYTLDTGVWKDRQWQTTPAEIIPDKHLVRATLPEGVKVFFFNLIDDRGLIVSSDFQTF